MDNSISSAERDILFLLREIPSTRLVTVYPYGQGPTGTQNPSPVTISTSSNFDQNGNIGNVIIPSAHELSDVPQIKSDQIFDDLFKNGAPCGYYESQLEIKNDQINVTFIAYSGGRQLAYATAQALKGEVFVDNIIMFGSSYRASNGMDNIGHIWEFIGEQDDLGNLGEFAGWDRYNDGYRSYGADLRIDVQSADFNIYAHSAT
jgi:hypothetical protein